MGGRYGGEGGEEGGARARGAVLLHLSKVADTSKVDTLPRLRMNRSRGAQASDRKPETRGARARGGVLLHLPKVADASSTSKVNFRSTSKVNFKGQLEESTYG